MILCFRSWVKLAAPGLVLATLAACGNNGAPPYAPEAPQALPLLAAARPGSAPSGPTPQGSTPLPPRSPAAGAPSDPHVLYDLREKCAADARQWYDHSVTAGGSYAARSMLSRGFISHYDSKANDCFVMTSAVSRIKATAPRKALLVEIHDLVDVLENRNIGRYSAPAAAADSPQSAVSTPATVATECRVADKTCASKEDWDTLTRPYMTD
jgi:hypothetical protein